MKSRLIVLMVSILLVTNSCSILEQAQEYERFIQCDFKLANIQVLEISGVDISSLNNGVYSFQAKVWATSSSGENIALSTPFYPLKISKRESLHKRVFAGKIIDKIT